MSNSEFQRADDHETILHAMDRCRAGAVVRVALPDTTVEITAERTYDEIDYTYVAETDGDTREIDGITAWKLISDHEFCIE